MTDAMKRALRTFIQSFVGSILTSGVLSGFAVDGVVDWSILSKVGVSSFVAGVIALLAFVQNALEDSKKLPTVLK